MPPLYYTSKLKRENGIRTRVRGGGGEALLVKGLLGSFNSDPRHNMTHHSHIFLTGMNIYTSFDPKNICCYNCMGGGEHPVLVWVGSSDPSGQVPKCFMLTD
jgi:hypothetical protein